MKNKTTILKESVLKQLKSLDIDKYNVDEVLEDGCIIISKK